MKRLLAAALALAALTAPAARAEDVRLLQTLYAGRGQTIVSPVSLNLALAMAAEGAKGDTRAQLLAAAGLTEADLPEYAHKALALNASGVRTANAAFVKAGLSVLPAYDALLKERYQAERFALGGDVNAEVNAWVKEKTDGLIDPLLDQMPDPNLQMMLVSAMALTADWAGPFAAGDTALQTFHAPEGDIRTDFMHKTAYMPYVEGAGYRAVRLAYADSTLGLTVVLPDGSLADGLEALAEQGPDFDGDAQAEVTLRLPKLSAADSLDLIAALKALGVADAFGTAADFSGIDGENDLMIGSVRQKTRLDIDEAGTTAAAASSVGMIAKAAPMGEPPVDFTVDRPFILLLTDGGTGLTLIAAAIEKP